MKKTLLAMAILLITTTTNADPWVDDWLNQMTVTNPGYFEGQRRGYFTGGGFQARWRMNNDYLTTIQPPRISAGCGGIDMFLGGLSFLDPDLLVQKFQRIIQAAPAVAFDMALKTMCKECSDTMTKMERAASWLNGLQMNECAMSKRLVATVSSGDPDIMGAMMNEISSGVSLSQALDRNWSKHQDKIRAANGVSPNPLDTAVQDCPADFRAIFVDGATNSGGASVIQNATTRVGLSGYGDIIRGYIGDVIITYNGTMYDASRIDRCRGNNDFDFDDFLTGQAEQRPVTGGACTANSGTSLYDWVEQRLQGIATKMETNAGGGFTSEEKVFIDSAPLPVLQVMKTAVMNGNVQSTIAVFREPLATAYAYRVMQDLLNTMDYALRKAQVVKESGPIPGGDPQRCQIRILQKPIQMVERMREQVKDMRVMARESYYKKVDELADFIRVARAEMDERERAQKAALDRLKSTN